MSKPSMRDIQEQCYFDISALAEGAGVQRATILAMLADQPVRRYQAELVLAALSEYAGQDYALDTVSVVLLLEQEGNHLEERIE